jgi:asparagine synthase (glutamine-hydrolysing)
VERQIAMSGHLDAAVRKRLFVGPLQDFDPTATARAIQRQAGGVPDDPLPATLHADGRLALVDVLLQYFDRTSMARSLEVRVPFLDHHVIELCASLPSDLKVRGRSTKLVLRQAARGVVPEHVLTRPKLGFFRHSVAGWLRAQAEATMADRLLDGFPRYAEFLDRDVVASMVADAASDHPRGDQQLLLAILLLEVWLSDYLPRAAGGSLPPGSSTSSPASAQSRCGGPVSRKYV